MLGRRLRAEAVAAIICIGACRTSDRFARRLEDDTIGRMATDALPAVVRIRGGGAMAQSSGAGFLVKGSGGGPLIVTNNHVIGGADDLIVDTSDGRSLAANVVGTDPATDIAVLRAPISVANGQLLSFSDGEGSHLGARVVVIGSPGGLFNALSVGVISTRGSVPTPTLAAHEFIAHLFIDAAVSAGDSGGPALDLDGRVVGVESAILAGTGLGIVIPGPVVEEVVKGVERYGTFRHGSIGVKVDNGIGIAATKGILVTRCMPDCALGELKVGDRIIAIDGGRVSSIGDFKQRVFMTYPGTKWLLEVERNGQKKNVTVILQDMTQARFVQEQIPASHSSRADSAGGG